ncbi:Probable LRR receptor-like serine/threonine-protein kinase At1g74360 [Linum perenne]
MAAVQVSKLSALAVILMVAVYFTAVSAQAPAPSPVPEQGAGYTVGASGAMICSSLLLSLVAMLRLKTLSLNNMTTNITSFGVSRPLEKSLLGSLHADLSNCQTLAYLNLSHNILRGEVNFTRLRSLEVIDLAKNRFSGGIQFDSPGMCMNLVVANLSENFFTGRVDHSFVGCSKLKYLDLSSNHFVGGLWSGFSKLKEFSASENGFNELHESDFDENCSLLSLDIAENRFTGTLPGNVSNCKNLTILNAGRNHFSGLIPSQIGTISGLASLLLGNNNFSSDIPETLLNLKNLTLVDLSRNSFGGKIQPISWF